MYRICVMLEPKTDLEIVPHMYDKARVCKIKHENYVGLSLFHCVLSFLLSACFTLAILRLKHYFTHNIKIIVFSLTR